MSFDPSSRSVLGRRDLGRFPSDSLFDRVGRAVCEAECLPRKELFESWELARRVRRLLRGGRVVDLACGHGLVAHLMLLLDDSSPSALAVDVALPASASGVAEAFVRAWPRLAGRVTRLVQPVETIALGPDDVVVCAHGCGALTDVVLTRAQRARARVAVLPCCHEAATCDLGALEGWIGAELDVSLAIDITRVARLRAAGYAVATRTIPRSVTPKNRLVVGWPSTLA